MRRLERLQLQLGRHAPVGFALLFVLYLGGLHLRQSLALYQAQKEDGRGLGLSVLVVALGVAGSIALAAAERRRAAARDKRLLALAQALPNAQKAAAPASFELPARDELAQLEETLTRAKQALEELFSEERQASERLTETMQRGLVVLQQLQSAARQPLDAAASSVEDVSVSIAELADRAEEAQQFTHSALAHAGQGVTVVVAAGREIENVAERVASSAATIQSLNRKSEDIDGIVSVIKDIADRTKVLAINAAIEAARAGQHGRGFSVVAEAVRGLAERTAQSTREVVTLIGGIQHETNRAVDSMQQAYQQVQAGLALSRQAADALARIHTGASQSENTVKGIAASTHELKSASINIAQHISALALTVRRNGKSIQSASAAAHEILSGLEAMRERLRPKTAATATATDSPRP